MVHRQCLAATACLLALVVTACSDGDPDPDVTNSPDASSATDSPSDVPTSTPGTDQPTGDPFAVPDEITPEYVDLVVNTLYEEWGNIVREVLETPDDDPFALASQELKDRTAAIFSGIELLASLEDLDEIAAGDRDGLLPADEFRERTVVTRQLKRAGPDCLIGAGTMDFSTTARGGGTRVVAYSLSPDGDNPTGWRVMDVLTNVDEEGEPLPDERMWEEDFEDLEPFLDQTCEDPS